MGESAVPKHRLEAVARCQPMQDIIMCSQDMRQHHHLVFEYPCSAGARGSAADAQMQMQSCVYEIYVKYVTLQKGQMLWTASANGCS